MVNYLHCRPSIYEYISGRYPCRAKLEHSAAGYSIGIARMNPFSVQRCGLYGTGCRLSAARESPTGMDNLRYHSAL